MSIPNEALSRLLQEIEQQAKSSQRELMSETQKMQAKKREIRKVELTSEEFASLPPDVKLYEGVGKMFVLNEKKAVEAMLQEEIKGLKGEVSALQKHIHYLEMTAKNSREHMDKILKSGGQF